MKTGEQWKNDSLLSILPGRSPYKPQKRNWSDFIRGQFDKTKTQQNQNDIDFNG